MALKELTTLIVSTNSISYLGEARKISIQGEPNAEFTLTLLNSAGVSKLDSPILDPSASWQSSISCVIPSSGILSFTQNFPPVTSSDRYTIKIKPRAGTILGNSFVNTVSISQWYTTTLTLTMISDDNAGSYATFPTSVELTGDAKVIKDKVQRTGTATTTSLSWEITGASGADITLSRQPKATDFSNNIANEFGEEENTFIDVKAISNLTGTKLKVSSTDISKISSGLVVKEKVKVAATKIEEEAEKITSDADIVETEDEAAARLALTEDEAVSSSEEATVKEVTATSVDASNNVVTFSTSQAVKYGSTVSFDNGGSIVSFKDLKAVQIADSVIKVTAEIKVISIGVQDVTSKLALDNFITV